MAENAHTLEEAEWILREAPRTCEYYYVISDGKSNTSLGVYATPSQIHFINPGSDYALLAPNSSTLPDDKLFLPSFQLKTLPYQTIASNQDSVIALFNKQPADALIITGFNASTRFSELAQNIEEKKGELTETGVMDLIKLAPRDSNLHNAIFYPAELKVWISHAENQSPAYQNRYIAYCLKELLAYQELP